MPLDLTPSPERFNRDRRRMTPRIFKVESLFGGNQCRVTFDRDMDTTQDRAVVRVFLDGVENREYTNFVWFDNRTMESTDFSTTEAGDFGNYAVYMRGNIREARRFMVWERERCDRLEIS